MQELIFEGTNDDHLGVISENPFEGQDADSNQSPDSGYVYSYLLGWKLFNADESIQRALLLTLQVRVKHCSSMAVQALQLIFDVFR